MDDRPRSGRPASVVDAEKQREVLWHTLVRLPEDHGGDALVAQLLAKRVGLHFTQVGRVWRHWGVQAWREESFGFSTDPQLEAKVRDVVGLSEATEPEFDHGVLQHLIRPLATASG